MLSSKFTQKISVFLKSVKIVKNWYLIPFIYFRLLTNEHAILILRNGYKVKLRVKSTDLQAFFNVWIIQEYNRPSYEILENDIIIDIGAHIGLFTLYVSQFCKKGRIFSFEPVDENYKLLLENIRLNKIENITAIKKAVTGQEKIIKIYLNEDQAAHSNYSQGNSFIETEAISLKEIIDANSIQKCNFLKIDCEGAEYDILRSVPDEYFKIIMKIGMEYHFSDTKSDLLKELKERLQNMDYKIEENPLLNGLGLLFAKRIEISK